MSLAQYLKDSPLGEKFILATIDPDGSPIRIADNAYRTESTDDPVSKVFRPIIVDVPRLSRAMRGDWGGGISGSWGPLKTATKMAGAINLATAAIRGKKIEIQMTGPRLVVPYADAATVLSGYIDSRAGDVGGGITINLRDRRHLLDAITLPPNRFDSAVEGVNFPASNDGKKKPLVLGKAMGVESPVLDHTTHKRLVSDPVFGVINNVTAVYNNGVSVSFTSDLVNNTYTPTVNPLSSEVITADIEGIKDSAGTFMTTLEQFIKWLLLTFSTYDLADIDIAGFPADDAYLVLDSDKSLTAILDELTKSVIGIWQCTRLDKFKARLIEEPAAGGPKFSEVKHLGDIAWKEENDIFYSIPFTYNRNHTPLGTLGAIATVSREIYLKAEGDEGEKADAAILSTYPEAKVAPVLKTFFVNKPAAESVAARGLLLYGKLRRSTTVKLPFVDPPLFILDSVNLSDADVLDGDCLITSIVEDFGAETPLFTVGVWQ